MRNREILFRMGLEHLEPTRFVHSVSTPFELSPILFLLVRINPANILHYATLPLSVTDLRFASSMRYVYFVL